ncbi:MAG: TIGR03663 family protein [Chloroflexi bacterium]|nr:TIGR03663 family protein [Chloroflexota bacterium]
MTARAARLAPERPGPLDRLLAVRIPLTWEMAIYIALFAAAIALRFWDLGSRALHHDESIHAQWSWKLAQGDYTHSPVFHGPLYYHLQGLAFTLFGATDYTARLTAALFGTGIVALPLLLRRRLGPAGTMAAVALLVFSPTLVYFSRFFREDIYMAFFVLAMGVAIWRYVDSGRERWLLGFALCFTGAMLTKEGTFLVAAILLVYLDLYLAADLAGQTLADRGLDSSRRRFVLAGAYAPYAWAVAAFWPFLGGIRKSFGWRDELPRQGDLLIILGTLVLPLLTPLLRIYVLEPLGFIDKDIKFGDGKLTSRLNWDQHLRSGITSADQRALGGLFAITISAAAFVGLQWRPKLWAILFVGCGAIYLTLMTSFWTNMNGLVSGPWGSLDYWATQQDETRGDQPWYYYYILVGAYEFLPVALALAGTWWAVVRGDAFSRFLAFWFFSMLLMLSWTSEKMPWNNTHLAVPACLLAAWTVSRAWSAWTDRPEASRTLPALAGAGAIAAGGLIVVAFAPGGSAYDVVRVVAAVAAVAAVVMAARPFGFRAAPMFTVVAIAAALALFSLRAMFMAAYERGDVPKDMLVYTQSSPDIARIADEIDALAAATGRGFDLPIAVDSTDSFSWPWAWYLRDYRAVSYVEFTNGPPTGDYPVLLVNSSNVNRVNDALAGQGGGIYGVPVRYPHRWWFDETYKQALDTGSGPCITKKGNCGPTNPQTWKIIAEGVFGGKWLDTWFSYWRDHDPDKIAGATGDRACNSCGSVDAFAFFPANFDTATGKLSLRPIEPPKPTADSEGRPMFGGLGAQPGQFFAPVDIEIDAAGNLYVIDRATKRLQKFDAAGNFLAAIDVRNSPQEGSEPWGLAIAPDGRVIVADTFGHRIRVFDKDLKPVLSFGQPADLSKGAPGPLDFFGPRDAVVDAKGQLWVTDTGNHRLLVFNLNGEPLFAVGKRGTGIGEFQEPVGLAIADDGAIYVADMYNSRVVILKPDGTYSGEFTVAGWGGQGVEDKPYLEALTGGRVAVGLPGLNQVRTYDRSGRQVVAVAPSEPLSRPYGIAATADGKLWVVEGGSGRVRLFAIP